MRDLQQQAGVLDSCMDVLPLWEFDPDLLVIACKKDLGIDSISNMLAP